MKKIILFIAIALISQEAISQKFVAKVFPDFNRNASMVLQSKPSNTNISGLIEGYLLMEGFDVRSEAISSSNQKEISNDVKDSKGIDQDISISNKTYIDSDYVIEINFSEQWDLIWKIKSCLIKISDLSSGKVVAIINKKSKGLRNPDSIAEGSVEALMKNLK